jgi:hypothetical protein
MPVTLLAPGFAEESVRRRARWGRRAVFSGLDPDAAYGEAIFGQTNNTLDDWSRLRIVPPIFVPGRMKKMVELGREPLYSDVSLGTHVGGFPSPLPAYVSALGSTKAAHERSGSSVARQAAEVGIPLVLGENVATVHGYAARHDPAVASFKERARLYADRLADGVGGLVVQQSTEDANAELWNRVYSDPDFEDVLATGRLGFELKVGQGAKPGLGGLTLVDDHDAARLAERFQVDALRSEGGLHLRAAAPGTFTEEILRSQIRLMRNNYPRAKTWVKLPPGRDVGQAAQVAWSAGADAVIVDGAEGGTGFAPLAFLQEVGLPLRECLRRILVPEDRCLLASGRFWEGSRMVKARALGASACGLGRAALLACDEDEHAGLVRLLDALDFELRLLVSALGKYAFGQVDHEDIEEFLV